MNTATATIHTAKIIIISLTLNQLTIETRSRPQKYLNMTWVNSRGRQSVVINTMAEARLSSLWPFPSFNITFYSTVLTRNGSGQTKTRERYTAVLCCSCVLIKILSIIIIIHRSLTSAEAASIICHGVEEVVLLHGRYFRNIDDGGDFHSIPTFQRPHWCRGCQEAWVFLWWQLHSLSLPSTLLSSCVELVHHCTWGTFVCGKKWKRPWP